MRRKFNLTQAQLAEKTGIHPVNLCKIETGNLPLSGKSLLELSRFFDVNPFFLLGEKKSE